VKEFIRARAGILRVRGKVLKLLLANYPSEDLAFGSRSREVTPAAGALPRQGHRGWNC